MKGRLAARRRILLPVVEYHWWPSRAVWMPRAFKASVISPSVAPAFLISRMIDSRHIFRRKE